MSELLQRGHQWTGLKLIICAERNLHLPHYGFPAIYSYHIATFLADSSGDDRWVRRVVTNDADIIPVIARSTQLAYREAKRLGMHITRVENNTNVPIYLSVKPRDTKLVHTGLPIGRRCQYTYADEAEGIDVHMLHRLAKAKEDDA